MPETKTQMNPSHEGNQADRRRGATPEGAPDLGQLVAGIVGQAKSGEDIEAFAGWDREVSVRTYEGEIEHLVSAESAGVGIRVVSAGKAGFAYCGTLDRSAIAEALAEARDNLTFATPDEFVGLAEPDGVVAPDLELIANDFAELDTTAKVAMALELESKVAEGDKRIKKVESSNYSDVIWHSALASTKGIQASTSATRAFIHAVAIASDGGEPRTGVGYSVGKAPGELSVDEAARDAIERSTLLLGAKKPKSGRLDVVFDPRVTSTLLSILAGTLSGEAVEKGRSLFAGRMGEDIGSELLTVTEDPTDPKAYLASCYDGEGLATRRTELVSKGVLSAYLYDSYSARRAGTKSTGSAVRSGFQGTPGVGARALSCQPGDLTQAEMIAGIENGILVTSISGVHSGVNPISGDFSVGAEGVLIRSGKLAEPVKEATIASTIQRMLLGVSAVGSDVEWMPSSAAGVSLAMADVSLSGD